MEFYFPDNAYLLGIHRVALDQMKVPYIMNQSGDGFTVDDKSMDYKQAYQFGLLVGSIDIHFKNQPDVS